MTEREKMVKAVKQIEKMRVMRIYEECADYLIRFLASELNLPPCKVGDTVYYVEGEMIRKGRIDKIEYNLYTDPHMWIEVEYRSPIIGTQIVRGRVDLFLNKIVFLTRKEAEKALKEREK